MTTATTAAPSAAAIDSKAFEILVRQHHRRVLSYALALVDRHDVAEDLAQEAFVTACRQLDSFDVNRDFGAWVRGILRNKYREWCRRRHELPVDPAKLAGLDQEHELWDRRETSPGDAFKALAQCLQKLPDMFREPVQLFYLKRLSGTEVATRLQTSEPTIRKRLERARGQLAECVTASLRD